MFQINKDDLSIYVTRGDAGVITVEASVGEGEGSSDYRFQPGDVLRLKVFGKKDCDNVVLQKDVGITEECDSVDILLTEQDTRIGDTINKPTDYWYEIELNPDSDPQTIVCYDEENGPKVFRLYPEGRELEGEIPSPEDIPIVDSVLDVTSMRPIQNQAVAREIIKLRASSKYHDQSIEAFLNRWKEAGSLIYTGIHVGDAPPDDESVDFWVDTSEDSEEYAKLICKINDGIRVYDSGLEYSRGVVEVRRIGQVLWIIDSGVYNFTESFEKAKNRTVLEFDLPKDLSNKIHNTNGVYGTTGTIAYFPTLAYENATYTTFNCQSYLKRSAIGEEADTYQLVYTGVDLIEDGGLCGFHAKMPIILVAQEVS